MVATLVIFTAWGQTNGNSAFSKDKQIKMTFKEIFQKTSGYMALV